MVVTSVDVARLAGVSQPTVSRALRGDPRVSAATRAKVENAVTALGYVPSEAGRSLVTRRTKRIGVVVSDLTNPFYPHLLDPLNRALDRHGFRMIMLTESSGSEVTVDQLVDGSVDGAVLLTSKAGSTLAGELARRQLPFVFLNRESGQGVGDSAVVDDELGGRIAARHLTELGHRRIAGIFGPSDTSTGRGRELGFRLALAEVGVALSGEYARHGDFDFDSGHRAMLELMALESPPTAVFCGNDVVAVGALNAAHAASIDVPANVSVVGFDDIPMAGWEVFRLTTIGHDLDRMATSAVELLIAHIKNKKGHTIGRTVVEPRLIERSTTSSPPLPA